jgi:Spy/CpxP family protein refolding chaperone
MIEVSYYVSIARRALLLSSILIASCSALFAQPDGPPPDGPPPGMQSEMPRGPSIERELSRLTRVLTLTEAQQTQVKAILTEQKQQMDALRKDAESEDNQPPAANREKAEAVREASNDKIAALLNDDQKAKFAAWEEQQKAARQRRQNQQGDQPPPPPPDGGGGPPPGL